MDLNKNQGLLDQSAFRGLARLHEDMHQLDRLLALQSDQGHPIPALEYDAFSEKVQNFNGQARRPKLSSGRACRWRINRCRCRLARCSR